MLTRDKNGSRDHDHAPRSVAISGRLQRISVARREIGFLSDVVTIADTQQVRLLGLSTAAFNSVDHHQLLLNRLHRNFRTRIYQSTIVSIALSCAIFEFLTSIIIIIIIIIIDMFNVV